LPHGTTGTAATPTLDNHSQTESSRRTTTAEATGAKADFAALFNELHEQRPAFMSSLDAKDIASLALVSHSYQETFQELLPGNSSQPDKPFTEKFLSLLRSSDPGESEWAQAALSKWVTKQADPVSALQSLLVSKSNLDRRAAMVAMSSWLDKHPVQRQFFDPPRTEVLRLAELASFKPQPEPAGNLRTLRYPTALKEALFDELPKVRSLAGKMIDAVKPEGFSLAESEETDSLNRTSVARLVDGRVEIDARCENWLTVSDDEVRQRNIRELLNPVAQFSDYNLAAESVARFVAAWAQHAPDAVVVRALKDIMSTYGPGDSAAYGRALTSAQFQSALIRGNGGVGVDPALVEQALQAASSTRQ
jgi:hypothetical protein